MERFSRQQTNRVETMGEAAARLIGVMDARRKKAPGRLQGPGEIRCAETTAPRGRRQVTGYPPPPANDNALRRFQDVPAPHEPPHYR